MQKWQLIQNIILLQSYYKFLYLGKYLEQEAKAKDFSGNVEDKKISTWGTSYFVIKAKMVKPLLENIYKNPDKKNLFGYLVEISAFRWLFGTFKELMDNEPVFQKFLKQKFGKQYVVFEQIIKFLRNVLSHSTTSHVNLKTDDFEKQKEYLMKYVDTLLDFKFLYVDFFPEWKWSKDYGMRITVDFKKLKDGASLFDIVSLHQLYMFSELCFNISEVFRMKYNLRR